MDYLEPCKYSTRLIEKLESLDTKNVLDFDFHQANQNYSHVHE
jgi:hypothetical protein